MQDEGKLSLLTIGEASNYLGVSIDTLRRWEKRGRIIPFRSPGGHRYYKKNELDALFGKRYTHDERSEELSDKSENENITQQEVLTEEKPRLLVEEHTPLVQEVSESTITTTKDIQIPQYDPVKVSAFTEPMDIPPPPPTIHPIQIAQPPQISAPATEKIEQAVVEYVAPPVVKTQESFLIPAPTPTVQQSTSTTTTNSSTTSSAAEQPMRIARIQKKEKKETVTMIIIISILVLVVILGIVLFVMLWSSSRSVISPSP